MGLIAWYKMDGDGVDDTGKNVDGTVTGTTTVGGKINEALSFNGSSDKVDFGNADTLKEPIHLSVSFWVKVLSYPSANYAGLVTKGAGALSTRSWSFSMTTTGTGYFFVRKADDSGYDYPRELVSEGDPWTVLPVGTYVHMVGVIKSGEYIALYQNGVLHKYLTITYAAPYIGDYTVKAGYHSSSGDEYANVVIDDIRIFDHALTLKEIKTLSMAKVGHWKFVADGVYTDSSGYGNHATVAGGSPVWTDSTEYGIGAITCDGDDYLSAVNELYNQPNTEQEWTVTAWVNIVDDGTNQVLVNFNLGCKLIQTTTNRLLLYLNDGVDDYYHYDDGSGPYLDSLGWKHVAFGFRHSDETRLIYVNAIDVTGVGPELGDPQGQPSSITMLSGVEGSVTDIRIYATLLTSTDIQNMFEQRAAIDSGGNLWL